MATAEEQQKATDTQKLIEAAGRGDNDALRDLFARGADANEKTETGETALMRAASNGHLDTVGVLLECGAEVNSRRADGITALIRAAFFGHAEVVRELLARGADVEAKDRLGLTALMWASSKGYPGIVEILRNNNSAEGSAPVTTGQPARPRAAELINAKEQSSAEHLDSKTFHLGVEDSRTPAPAARFDANSLPLNSATHSPGNEDEQPITHRVGVFRVETPAPPLREEIGVEAPDEKIVASEGDTPERGTIAPGTNIDVYGAEAGAPLRPTSRLDSQHLADSSTPVLSRADNSHSLPRRRRLSRLGYAGLALLAVALITGVLAWFAVGRRLPRPLSSPPVADSSPAGGGVPQGIATQTAAPSEATNVLRPAQTEAGAADPSRDTQTQGATGSQEADGQAEDGRPDPQPQAGERATLRTALGDWVAATNSRDVDKQMTFYAPTLTAFYRARNVSQRAARAEKSRLSTKSERVDIRAGKPEITFSSAGRKATMRFNKTYVIGKGARARRGEVVQELIWQRTDGKWKIISERDVRVVN